MTRSPTELLDDPRQPFLISGLRTPKQVFRALRNYLAGQFVGATRDEALLDEVLKCLFCKLYLETVDSNSGLQVDDEFGKAQFYRGVFQAVRRDFPEIYGPEEELLLDPRTLDYVLQNLDFSTFDSAETDPIGDAFEIFVGAESRGRSGQFFTPRNATDLLVEAVDPQPGEKVIDPACGSGTFLASVARHYRLNGHSVDAIKKASSKFFGIEKDDYLARLARLHISLLTRGHPNVVCGDSLALSNGQKDLKDLIPIQEEYDIVLTNPPFGVKIVAAAPDVLKTFDLARRWRKNKANGEWQPTADVRNQVPPQVLFVERCLSLLRPGGRLGVVLPESVLSNKSYRYVIEYLRTNSRIEAVIGMPESLFKTSGKGGTHTKTCLVVAVKRKSSTYLRQSIFMAEARWCGKDSRAREIPKDDLPQIRKHLTCFRKRKKFQDSRLGFRVHQEKVADNVLCPRYYDPDLSHALQDLAKTHHLVTVGDLVGRGILAISTGDEVGKLAYGSGSIPFVRTSDLSNWEIKINPKQCINQELYDSLKGKQDIQPNDLLMVKDGTYLIGTCAIVTEYDQEIVYQSHLYKIRVLKQLHGLNPYLLLAVLTSRIVQRQIRAKQFTQDIIDSLGERITELVLPIPRASELRNRVSVMVEKVIRERIEARELARRAAVTVLGESYARSAARR